MNRLLLPLIAAALSLQACGSKPVRYPGTDVMEIPGFRLKTATDLQQSGNTLQSGTLVYAGKGNVQEVYKGYVEAMNAQGWVTTYSNIGSDKANGTLRKDRRICYVEFVADDDKHLRGTVRVTQAEGQAD